MSDDVYLLRPAVVFARVIDLLVLGRLSVLCGNQLSRVE
jgi:hypothetical protein